MKLCNGAVVKLGLAHFGSMNTVLSKKEKKQNSAQSTTRNLLLSSQEGHVTPALQPTPKPELGFSMESKRLQGLPSLSCLAPCVLHLLHKGMT